MQDSDLSSIYDYARTVLNNEPQGVYKKKKSELKKRIAAEKKEYARAAGSKTSKYLIVILLIICVCIVLAITFLFKREKESEQEITTSDVMVTTSADYEDVSDAYVNSETTVDDNIITETEIQTESVTEVIEEALSSTDTTAESSLFEFEEDSAESYNGFKLGDIVYYSGTVHYVSSNSNKLGGACRGGMAMISGIQPDAIHKFHLVAADDNCTVYGWVDEVFVKPIDDNDS